jgi:hypothetical protein
MVGIGETDCVASMLEDKRGPSLRRNRAAIYDANQGFGGAVNDIAASSGTPNVCVTSRLKSRPACGHWSRPWTLQLGNSRWPHSRRARPQWLRQSSTPLKKPRRLRQRASAVSARVTTPSASDTADSTQSGQRSVTTGADAGHTLTAPPRRGLDLRTEMGWKPPGSSILGVTTR